MKDTDLAWLAGMWEGEGSILLYRRPAYKGKRQGIIPSMEITNTDICLVNRCSSILDKLECSFHFSETKKYKTHHKQAYRLRTTNAKTIVKTLDAIIPHMVGEKKAKGELVKKFLTRRLEKAADKGMTLKHVPYDEEDFEALRSSETTR